MTDKELRSLSRKDMLDLLCQLKQEEIDLRQEVSKLKQQLAEKNYKFNQAGTLADAVISVNGVLEAAQRAADDYLEEVRKAHDNTTRQCAEMTSKTEAECRKREREADLQISSKWEEFGKKVDDYMQTRSDF